VKTASTGYQTLAELLNCARREGSVFVHKANLSEFHGLH
jgi:hypothetical protein